MPTAEGPEARVPASSAHEPEAGGTPSPRRVDLRFSPTGAGNSAIDDVTGELSAAAFVGDALWLGSDEGAYLERLRRLDDLTFGAHQRVGLATLLYLPGGELAEVDVEGLAAADGCLWVVGSHGRKRRKPGKADADPRKRLKRLAKVQHEPNRYLVARLPLGDDGSLTATACACLPMHTKGNRLTDALKSDKHLGPFMRISDKDNGFCVEGLAAAGNGRLFVGLRGPVLRGWAVVLELQVQADEKRGVLTLAPIGPRGRPYRKHFLDLRGLGIRDLYFHGSDLLILAGPTMTLEGESGVFRWSGALHCENDSLVDREHLPRLIALPHGTGAEEFVDHPEGMAVIPTQDGDGLLVVYDAPSDRRRQHHASVHADLFPLPPRP